MSKRTQPTRRELRQARGLTLADIPVSIPADIRTDALDILKVVSKRRDYRVYIGGCGPRRNQWLIVEPAIDHAVTVREWCEHYYSFRRMYDAWQASR